MQIVLLVKVTMDEESTVTTVSEGMVTKLQNSLHDVSVLPARCNSTGSASDRLGT